MWIFSLFLRLLVVVFVLWLLYLGWQLLRGASEDVVCAEYASRMQQDDYKLEYGDRVRMLVHGCF